MKHVKSFAVKLLNTFSGGKFRPAQPALGQRELAKELHELMEIEPWVIDFSR